MGRIWQLPQEQDELDGAGSYACTCLPRYDDDGDEDDYNDGGAEDLLCANCEQPTQFAGLCPTCQASDEATETRQPASRNLQLRPATVGVKLP